MGRNEKPIFAFATLVIAMSSLSGCGGGGGGGGATNIVPEDTSAVIVVPTVTSPYSAIGYQQTLVKAPSLWNQGITGNSITVAVLDSGVTASHDEFKDMSGNSRVRLDIAKSYISDGMGNVYVDTDVTDTPLASYHGTSVASIALGQTTGIAPEASLLPIKISADGFTYLDAVQQGVRYAAQYSDLINVSYSGMVNFSNVNYGLQPSEYTLAKSLFNEHPNFALIVAAGNDGLPNGTDPFLDSTLSNLSIATEAANRVLNVISVDSSGVRSGFSNYPGSCADVYASDPNATCDTQVMASIQANYIAAPGQNVTVADGSTTTDTKVSSGTSFAAPNVTGGLALLLSSWDQLTAAQAVQILKQTADKSFAWYTSAEYGSGIMDLEAAMSPVGTLMSGASAASLRTVALNESSATLPSGFSVLKASSALKSAAFFDDFNRDYAVDVTSMMATQKQPIDWQKLWGIQNSQQDLTRRAKFGSATLGLTYDSGNTSGIGKFTIDSQAFSLHAGKAQYLNANEVFGLAQTPAFSLATFTNRDEKVANVKTMLSPTLSLASGFSWHDSYSLVGSPKSTDFSSRFGLNYAATDSLSFGIGIEWLNQNNAIGQLQGEGVLSFGQDNLTQLNALSMTYQKDGWNAYALVKAGWLNNSSNDGSSYIQVKDAMLGQTVFGFNGQVDRNRSFGISAYRNLDVIDAQVNLNVPVGMNADGVVMAHDSLKYQSSLLPNTLEAHYAFKSQYGKGFDYTLNLIHGQQDSGAGFSIQRRF